MHHLRLFTKSSRLGLHAWNVVSAAKLDNLVDSVIYNKSFIQIITMSGQKENFVLLSK